MKYKGETSQRSSLPYMFLALHDKLFQFIHGIF